MKQHSTNYQNTFVEIAEDSPVIKAEVPQPRNGKETVASLQYRLIHENPYRLSSDDVLFQVHVQRNDISAEELEDARKQFFSKGQACMRASPLTKRYGWGIHNDAEGKIALVARESEDYERLLKDERLEKVRAMRSTRKTEK